MALRYPLAGDVVDGRRVRDYVPNLSSIEASVAHPTVLPGIRKISMASFTLDDAPPATDSRTHELAEEIQISRELNPLIVGIDEKGPYIIEGGHRYDALKLLGAKAFPAVVVLEEGVAQNPQRFWGRSGAGILFHCVQDDTYLLALRSDQVEQPGTLGIPGGSCEGEGFFEGAEGREPTPDEAWACAKRETMEEFGWFPKEHGDVKKIIYRKQNFTYTTFVVGIRLIEKFNAEQSIHLNWENDAFVWMTRAKALSDPDLHFGVKYVLENIT